MSTSKTTHLKTWLRRQAVCWGKRGVRDVITVQGRVGASWPHWDEWNPALIMANTARFNFHAAAIRTLRQPPSPEGEREGQEE
ncbi:hypothetical protein ACIRL0_36500 [Streptomyces sp. NPDC102365]|uniref:hypothetical protein n=1 Tax=Streptomyces sp. NPDC102365 TaxID=3366162 RepID=UPI00381A691D